MSALSREMGISLSAVTQMADRLERAHLVERVAEGDDRRVKTLQLTAHGQEIMRTRNTRRVQRVQQVIAGLPGETRREIVDALQQLLAACSTLKPSVPEGAEVSELLED